MEGAQVSLIYLASLLFSIAGLAALDYRHRLAIAKSKKNIWLILIPVVFFLTWDLAGISAGIFFRGDATHLTGILLAHELPLEELFFLILLSYSSLLLLMAFTRMEKRK
jgi:lycopene cyclase domain-containing protein